MSLVQPPDHRLDQLLERLLYITDQVDDLPDPTTPLGQMTREFFTDSWEACRDGLLQKTTRIRVVPQPLPAPRIFSFEIDLPFKRKLGRDTPVELMPGPIRGTVIYRPDFLANLNEPCVAVRIDPSLGFFHCNYSRRFGLLCLGDTTAFQGPIPLDILLANHLYPILTYQNRSAIRPADLDAAHYFALDPQAMVGLEPVPPLY
ncbi:MAG: hypothetical protein AB7U20_14400 [Planctomycetaceae bacterium]